MIRLPTLANKFAKTPLRSFATLESTFKARDLKFIPSDDLKEKPGPDH